MGAASLRLRQPRGAPSRIREWKGIVYAHDLGLPPKAIKGKSTIRIGNWISRKRLPIPLDGGVKAYLSDFYGIGLVVREADESKFLQRVQVILHILFGERQFRLNGFNFKLRVG